MKYREFKNKSLQDLQDMVENLRIELGKSSFDIATNTLKNTGRIKEIKRDIARILTAIKVATNK